MVGLCPDLEPEVGWRVDHVISKWNMLTSLRNKSRTMQQDQPDLPDVYTG